MTQQIADERQPLLPEARKDGVSPAVAAPQHAAASSSGGDSGASLGGGGSGAEPALLTCRICLQEDDASNLDNPCSCSGSMQWAHRDCIQRWIDEKHDKTCEICGQPFRGAFADPPPRPPPPAPPLLAQLQIDEASNRRVLVMRDAETGEVVARVMVPARLGSGGAGAGGGERMDGAQEEEGQPEWGQQRLGRTVAFAATGLLCFCILAAFVWCMSPADEGNAGQSSMVIRILVMAAWVLLHTVHTVIYGRQQRTVRELGYRSMASGAVDLEAGRFQWRRRR